MRGRFAKIGMLFLALVACVGVMGVGVAHWTDALNIEGTVETGVVCLEFVEPRTVLDRFAPPPYYPPVEADWNCGNGFVNVHEVDKNVGWGSAVYVGSVPYKTLEVSLFNTYPGYYNHVDFWVHNCGTVPVVIDRVVLRDAGGNILAEITSPGIMTVDLSGDGDPDFEINWGDNFGVQVHPCNSLDLSFGMHVMQDDIEASTLRFYVDIVGLQWNGHMF